MSVLTSPSASRPSVFSDGDLLRVVRGEFAGKTVRVSGTHSFWTPETFYEGDPAKGRVSPEGWQIVVDIEVDGQWLYLLREDETELLRFVERVVPEGKASEDVAAGDRADFDRRVAKALDSTEFDLAYLPHPRSDPDPTPYGLKDLLDLVLRAEEEMGHIVRLDTGEKIFDAADIDSDGGSFAVPWLDAVLLDEEA